MDRMECLDGSWKIIQKRFSRLRHVFDHPSLERTFVAAENHDDKIYNVSLDNLKC